MNLLEKTKFFCKKNAPEIFLGMGIAGIIGTVVMSNKETLILNEKMKVINNAIEDTGKMEPCEYKDNHLKELKKQARKEVIKAYAPAAGLLVLSVTCLLASYNIQKAREAAISAAYLGLKKSFDSYRQRVADNVGEEKEKEIYGSNTPIPKTPEGIQEKVEGGKTPAPPGFFDFTFDSEISPQWRTNAAENYETLLMTQKYINTLLNSRGYVTVADVYKAIGVRFYLLPKQMRMAANLFGWVKGKNESDVFIDFGICDAQGNLSNESFVNQQQGCTDIPVRLNPQGNIYEGENNYGDVARDW